MPKFFYRARDSEKKLTEGIRYADSRKHLVAALRAEGVFAVYIREIVEQVYKQEKKSSKVKQSRRRVKLNDVAVFCRQMATMINAGVSILDAVEDIAGMVTNVRLRKTLQSVAVDIRGGGSFSSALRKYPKIFSKIVVAMVAAGEESGQLAMVLKNLASYLEESVKLRNKVRAASAYPFFVGIFFFVALSGIVLIIVPKFKELFASFGAELPLPTRIVTGLSEAMLKNMHWVLFLIAGIITGISMIYKTRPGRYKIDNLKFRLPVIGVIIMKVTLARFFQTLAILFKSGVEIVTSLDIASKVLDHYPMELVVEQMKIKLLEGSSLMEEMGKYPVFPKLAVRMVSVGEKTGKIDEMLEVVADYYKDEVDTVVAQLSSIIEPVLIIMLGFIVAIVVIALYLPIFRMAMTMMSGEGM
ncbi:MAG TPA: type II secretion system F family protein [bacterium]|nr:type II secretion system F family protein [bacterium]